MMALFPQCTGPLFPTRVALRLPLFKLMMVALITALLSVQASAANLEGGGGGGGGDANEHRLTKESSSSHGYRKETMGGDGMTPWNAVLPYVDVTMTRRNLLDHGGAHCRLTCIRDSCEKHGSAYGYDHGETHLSLSTECCSIFSSDRRCRSCCDKSRAGSVVGSASSTVGRVANGGRSTETNSDLSCKIACGLDCNDYQDCSVSSTHCKCTLNIGKVVATILPLVVVIAVSVWLYKTCCVSKQQQQG